MLDFLKWCESEGRKLPTITEKVHRSGIRGQYPDAYAGRGYAYPDGYWSPHSASAFLDLKNAKGITQVKDKAGKAAN